jgi:hypothetical protein
MKQRIDESQLAELSDDQKQRLRDWWKPQIGDMFAWITYGSLVGPLGPIVTHEFSDNTFFYGKGTDEPEEFHKNGCIPLLSIGQMMELLSDLGESYREVLDGDYDYITEACDRLFEAVKRVLK